MCVCVCVCVCHFPRTTSQITVTNTYIGGTEQYFTTALLVRHTNGNEKTAKQNTSDFKTDNYTTNDRVTDYTVMATESVTVRITITTMMVTTSTYRARNTIGAIVVKMKVNVNLGLLSK